MHWKKPIYSYSPSDWYTPTATAIVTASATATATVRHYHCHSHCASLLCHCHCHCALLCHTVFHCRCASPLPLSMRFTVTLLCLTSIVPHCALTSHCHCALTGNCHCALTTICFTMCLSCALLSDRSLQVASPHPQLSDCLCIPVVPPSAAAFTGVLERSETTDISFRALWVHRSQIQSAVGPQISAPERSETTELSSRAPLVHRLV